MSGLTVAVIGLGYFSQFHLQAWQDDPRVDKIVATDLSEARRDWARQSFEVDVFEGATAAQVAVDVDIVDIVAPPPAHANLIEAFLRPGRIIVCQKPFCTSLAEAEAVVAKAAEAGCKIVVHENFRFQPWHRTIKAFLDAGKMGQVYQGRFGLRPGDGRGEDAYSARQPAFRDMSRLLIHETGVHFVDLFQWLFGTITAVYADLVKINPVLRGEDAGQLQMTHASGTRSLFDGNRLMDHVTDNPRRTMGEMWIEGEAGSLRLDGLGRVFFREFGTQQETAVPLVADVDDTAFGGGCVAYLCQHVAAAATHAGVLENEARDYLSVIRATEAAYESHATGRKIQL
ncbi:Inositol 2-dehydrogenase [Shimia sp. SK013]|uniref:Gfo/Idh/MocA family protein n=1 Tax=Shimia sp. SK013 TaxID=1389006 RepID=UPI0006B68D11|nr:Gfo/Idh/MocA family oxidoreductase [Shimia sp. SK013]KPA20679.1 Inositol 2-dehydrogenase [Shimia sp. SK013]